MFYRQLLISLLVAFVLTGCSQPKDINEYLSSAQSYIDKAEYKSAIIELKNAIKLKPKNAEARALLGKTYITTLSYDAALKEFDRAVKYGYSKEKLSPSYGLVYQKQNKADLILSEIKPSTSLSNTENAKIHALRAGALFRMSKDAEAKKELNLAKNLDENDSDVRLIWASYEARNKNTEQQVAWLKPLLNKNVADAWSQMGGLHQQEGNLETAEADFSNAIQARKIVSMDFVKRALIRISLKKFKEANADLAVLKKAGVQLPIVTHSEGVIAFYQNDLDLAQRKFDEILGKYKAYPPSLMALGVTHFKKGNFESAVKNLEQYLASVPNNEVAEMILATSLLRLNKAPEAIKLLQKLRNKSPENPEIASLLGTALIVDNQLTKGVKALKSAVKLDPKGAKTQFQLGSALLKNKSSRSAGQNALLKAIDLDPGLVQANISLYASYLQSKDFAAARGVANKMIENKPDNSLAYNLLANVEMASKQVDKAKSIYEKTLTQFPNDPITSMNFAKLYIFEKKYDEAKKLYLGVLEKKPSDLRSLIQLALLSAKDGDRDQVEKYLKEAVGKNPTVLSPKLLLAGEYLKKQEFEKVVLLLQETTELEQQRPEVMMVKAKAKMGMKEYSHSLVTLKKLVSAAPQLSAGHFLLGQNYGYLNKKDKMKAAFIETLKINPDHFSAALILARLSLAENNQTEFNQRLKGLQKAHPENPDVLYLQAKAESRKSNFSSAISTLESLLKSTPHPEVVLDLARNKWRSGDKEGAIAGIELWLADNAEDKKALMMVAQFYIDQNRLEDAKEAYARVDKLLPDNALILNNMAWLYRDSNIAEGIKLAKRALALQPNSPFIKDTLAILLLGNNKASEALKYAKEAAEAQPNFLEIQLNYAKVLMAMNDKNTAKTVLDKAYKLAKTFDQRQEVRSLQSTL